MSCTGIYVYLCIWDHVFTCQFAGVRRRESMRREHCDVDPGRADSKEWAASNRVWSTGNYHLSTTPRQEYRCAAFPSYHLSHHRFGPTLVRGMDYRGGPQAPVHNNARVP